MSRRCRLTVAVVLLWAVLGLWVEGYGGVRLQLALAVLTAAVLAGLLALQPTSVRLQTMLVVVVATCGEVVGSLIWGVYDYRLENLPAFVPPGHGLVYLAGYSLASGRRNGWLIGVATVCVASWGFAGLTILPTTDISGAIGCGLLAGTLVVTRRPVYAGVFLVVAALELYGTAVGTWRWEAVVPGLGLPQGNPPSGAASGYVLFDILALALAPRIVALGSRVRRLRRLAGVWTRLALAGRNRLVTRTDPIDL